MGGWVYQVTIAITAKAKKKSEQFAVEMRCAMERHLLHYMDRITSRVGRPHGLLVEPTHDLVPTSGVSRCWRWCWVLCPACVLKNKKRLRLRLKALDNHLARHCSCHAYALF